MGGEYESCGGGEAQVESLGHQPARKAPTVCRRSFSSAIVTPSKGVLPITVLAMSGTVTMPIIKAAPMSKCVMFAVTKAKTRNIAGGQEGVGRASLPQDKEDEGKRSARHECSAQPVERTDTRERKRGTRQGSRDQCTSNHIDGSRESRAGAQHEQDERDGQYGEGYVDPEHPAPIEVANYHSSPQRADHSARFGSRADDAERQRPLPSREEVAHDCYSYGYQRTGPDGLEYRPQSSS